MSLRVSLCHSCFDQNKVSTFIAPWLSDSHLSKEDFNSLWKQAAESLGEVRKVNCRCSYRITSAEAEILVKHGIADYLITEWRFNEEKKKFFPAPNPNLVWGGKQAEDLGLVRSSKAMKTPRVMTIEKANLQRAYLDGNQDEIDRIEVWGELAREVIFDLTATYWPEPFDPFKGQPVLGIPPGWNQRSSIGRNIESTKQSTPKC